jgi:hypothetical protein
LIEGSIKPATAGQADVFALFPGGAMSVAAATTAIGKPQKTTAAASSAWLGTEPVGTALSTAENDANYILRTS